MKKAIIYLAIMALVFTLVPRGADARKEIQGIIYDASWTLANSPYLIVGDAEIPAGQILYIDAGVSVRFNNGAKLTVHGELRSLGEESREVTFTALSSNPERGVWGGVKFANDSTDATFTESGDYAAGSILRYTRISWANSIESENANPYIMGNTFTGNIVGMDISGLYRAGKTMRVEKNNFNDNETGVRVNRASLDAGTSSTNISAIALVKGNSFSNNGKGILVVQGNNTAILDNEINNNVGEGVEISPGLSQVMIERNNINNNNVGILNHGTDTYIRQNAFNYNSLFGVKVSNIKTYINDNNFDNKFNIGNSAGAINVRNNFWNTTDKTAIMTSIENVSGVGAAVYEPIRNSAIFIRELLLPTINNLAKTTTVEKITIGGTKYAETGVYIAETEVSAINNLPSWKYETPLVLGENTFVFYLKRADSARSADVTFTITRLKPINAPQVNAYDKETRESSMLIAGKKDLGTAIIVNGETVENFSERVGWNFIAKLVMGKNEFVIYSKDVDGYESSKQTVIITRLDIDPAEVVAQEKKLSTTIDVALTKRLAGRILLQVEKNGEAWYLNPVDQKRYFMGRMQEAFELMRKFGLGIKHDELAKYLAGKFPAKLSGRIMLDVEKNGEAYYVNPVDMKGYSLGRPADAFRIMRELGLGIKNVDIYKIEVGD